MWIHPQYDTATKVNDIALLKLESPLNLGLNPKAIVMPAENQSFVDETCIATGWGATISGA